MPPPREARKLGQLRVASDHLAAALSLHARTGEAIPRTLQFDLAALLFNQGRLDEALAVVTAALERRPKDFALVNLHGVVLKALGRLDEALKQFDLAAKLDPKSLSPLVNRGNIYLMQRDGKRAVEVFTLLTRKEPRSAEYLRLLASGYRALGELDKALSRLELSLKLDPKHATTWREIAAVLDELGRNADALATLERGIATIGAQKDLVDAQIILLRRGGRRAEAIALLERLIPLNPTKAWLHVQMGRSLAPVDRDRANKHFAEAVKLEPGNTRTLTELAESLDRTRGPQEAQNIAAAYELATRRLKMGGNFMQDAKTLRGILIRSGDYEAAETLGDFDELCAHWANAGEIAGLHHMMGQVRTPAQRRSLVQHHRAWGRKLELLATKTPITKPPARAGRAKVRVGFMSSDLRDHPVAYFAIDLLTRFDKSRFEFYAYSWSTRPADPIQDRIAAGVDAFRHVQNIGDRAAAQLIADDDLDILFELGGSTDMNKLDVMAWKPAPRQASWLGYPHSAGLGTIDRILVDPFLKPEDPALLVEKPFEMPRTWVALNQPTFRPLPPIDPATPQERNGFVTFGTMNNPYKFNAAVIETWAEALRGVPDSRFMFVRPESAVPSFRANMARRFESHGIAADRILHVAVRGGHLPHYNAIDVALDSFPQTGGTTTCETLWMGVPAVTLVGEAFYERLSYSNLNNAGLGECCAFDRAGFVAKAIELAGRTQWRTELRRTMHERLRDHPLGNPMLFVNDFQDTLLRWMDEQP